VACGTRLGPDFTAMWGASGAGSGIGSQTEAQNIAGTVKPVVNIPCPAFTGPPDGRRLHLPDR